MEAGGTAKAVHLPAAAHAVQAPTAKSLGAALGTALDPGTRARAKAVAGTIRIDGTTVAAELLLSSAGA
jgi:vancomycin aglycone glucosyltransferase